MRHVTQVQTLHMEHVLHGAWMCGVRTCVRPALHHIVSFTKQLLYIGYDTIVLQCILLELSGHVTGPSKTTQGQLNDTHDLHGDDQPPELLQRRV